MADDDFPEDEVEFVDDDLAEDDLAEDIDPEDLDEELVEADDEESFVLDDDALVDVDVEEEVEEDLGPRAPVVAAPAAAEEDDYLEMVNEDDVEADLDTILKDRLTAETDEPDEEEEDSEVDDRGEPVDRIAPKRPDEFVCQSCFLLKTPNQLADPDKMLCSDCV
jgi:hypothetical protein